MFTVGSVQFECERVFPPEYPAHAINSERVFEVPLLKYYVNKFSNHPNFIEVGACSKHFMPVSHPIYDAQEKGAINEFAENLKYEGKNVLCISTIEHIGAGHFGLPYQPLHAITVLNMILDAETYLITFPIFQNTLLDYYVRNIIQNLIPLNVKTASRDVDNNWKVDAKNNFDYKYGTPYPYANGVCIITNLPELV
jgi:hypothetical protein